MDARFRRWAADHADSLARAFACARIGLGALATHGQAAQVPDAAITFDRLQPLQIHSDLPPQVTFDYVFAILDSMHDLRELLLGQIFGADARINVGLRQDDLRVARANPINVPQRNFDALVWRNF